MSRPNLTSLLAVLALVLAATLVLGGMGLVVLAWLGSQPDATEPDPFGTAPPSTPSPTPTATPPTATRPTAPEPALLLVWGRDGVPAATLAAVADVPEVEAVALLRSDTLGLVGSRDANGARVDDLQPGWRIPVDAAAIDPAAFAELVTDGPDRDRIAALQPGEVLLSVTSARLRRLGVGSELDLEGLADLRVAGVVADGQVGRAEVVLHTADADAAGLRPDGTLVVRHTAAPGGPTADLADQVAALVPADRTVRVVDGRERDARRAPLVLSLAQVKDRFGEFAYRPVAGARDVDIDPRFRDTHIVTADVPILGTVRCHTAIVDDLRGALQDVLEAGLASEIDPDRYAGCFNARRISADRARLSRHAWGIALDINVDLSLPGLGPPPHPEVVAAFERHGFRWGGDFIHPDNHHFEWVGAGATETVDAP